MRIVLRIFSGNAWFFKLLHLLLGWEGSDDWLRLQFKAYLLCLLSTVENTPGEECMSSVYTIVIFKSEIKSSVTLIEQII